MFAEIIKEIKRKKLIANLDERGYTHKRSMLICPEAVIVTFSDACRLIVYPKVFGYMAYYYNNISDNLEPTIFEYADLEFILAIIESIVDSDVKFN